jgi:glycine/D-amino acid oxidase-like deaminating enzyme
LAQVNARDGAAAGIATNVGDFGCQVVVLCTGAWSPALARRLGVATPEPLRSKVIQVNLVQTDRNLQHLPAFVDLDAGTYGRPHNSHAAFIGSPVDTWDIDPDVMESPAATEWVETMRRGKGRFDWLDTCKVIGGYRRHDAYSNSGGDAIAWSPTLAGVLVAAGFSGSGIKLAPAAGDRVCELVRESLGRRAAGPSGVVAA